MLFDRKIVELLGTSVCS